MANALSIASELCTCEVVGSSRPQELDPLLRRPPGRHDPSFQAVHMHGRCDMHPTATMVLDCPFDVLGHLVALSCLFHLKFLVDTLDATALSNGNQLIINLLARLVPNSIVLELTLLMRGVHLGDEW
eukprot:CAMPEP_0181212056 /NCGR_PEP_ID=MMETSP1096-20121128/24137_1 /TAXON_ID=156174 ORGANISM="Chrysochromulina ericina, Strain CCMP281" /NCGR_SAMPLE_ID=MMETSP1096 /ASSEMBLY_ACC=CAM_ASM_000453 /LENGTH=126 /DNA_ID=CAMNT_0023303541 /DNA_START=325 /DNA_END=702 /DNA_ORIENTATION=-